MIRSLLTVAAVFGLNAVSDVTIESLFASVESYVRLLL